MSIIGAMGPGFVCNRRRRLVMGLFTFMWREFKSIERKRREKKTRQAAVRYVVYSGRYEISARNAWNRSVTFVQFKQSHLLSVSGPLLPTQYCAVGSRDVAGQKRASQHRIFLASCLHEWVVACLVALHEPSLIADTKKQASGKA